MEQDFQFGLKNGKIVHANEVESGLQCNCYCPCCGNRFVAYKGQILRPHFKHLTESNCKYSFETSLHYLAKEIIQQKKFLDLPLVNWEIPATPSSWFQKSNGKRNHTPPFREVQSQRVFFDKVEVEQWEGNFRPDLKCYVGDKQLLIEITVTHGIDKQKLEKIENGGMPLLEIDLSHMQYQVNKKTLSQALYKKETLHSKIQTFKWIHNPKCNKTSVLQEQKSQRIFDFLSQNRKYIKLYGRNKEIYNCPLLQKTGTPYRFADTCEFCNYNLGKVELSNQREDSSTRQTDWAVMCIGHKKYELEILFKESGAKNFIQTSNAQ